MSYAELEWWAKSGREAASPLTTSVTSRNAFANRFFMAAPVILVIEILQRNGSA